MITVDYRPLWTSGPVSTPAAAGPGTTSYASGAADDRAGTGRPGTPRNSTAGTSPTSRPYDVFASVLEVLAEGGMDVTLV
ncbi:hypothetical protein ACIP93_18675 [Streptomyces sp. NPDC088745]|uniref:hypothetical protein n=1 Tax=Streptomyces sp. NPDC088745 TaxID=3365884 RepID=UPI0038096048